MKDKLLKRQEELQKEFNRLGQVLVETQTQMNKLSGAWDELDRQIKELDTTEVKENENQT